MTGVSAEYERATLQERLKAGLARPVARGAKLGRPQISACKEWAIRETKAEGLSIRADRPPGWC
jgi:DNA invertase Pin-like site-specific DNA recombinase